MQEFKYLHLYSYRVTAVQELKSADYPKRLYLWNWLVYKLGNNVLVCFQHKKHI
jgi:hypothetical protein